MMTFGQLFDTALLTAPRDLVPALLRAFEVAATYPEESPWGKWPSDTWAGSQGPDGTCYDTQFDMEEQDEIGFFSCPTITMYERGCEMGSDLGDCVFKWNSSEGRLHPAP